MRSGHPAWTQSRRTLSVPQASGDLGDERPLSIFAAALRAPDGGHETSAARFFGSGTRAVPAAVAADRLSGSTAPDGWHAARLPRAAAAAAGPVDHAALRLRHGAPAAHRPAGAEVPRSAESVRDHAQPLGRLAPEGRLRARPGLGRPRAPMGRVPPAKRLGLRGGVWAPHDHPGRLLPVQRGGQPRLAQLAPLPAADGLRRSRARARDPPLQRRGPVEDGGPPLRAARAVHELQGARHLGRPRLLAAARGRRVRPRHTRPALLRGAARRLPTRPRRPPSGST